MVSLRPILRDARFQRAPQDEALFRGKILNPHGEEPAKRASRTMKARHFRKPSFGEGSRDRTGARRGLNLSDSFTVPRNLSKLTQDDCNTGFLRLSR